MPLDVPVQPAYISAWTGCCNYSNSWHSWRRCRPCKLPVKKNILIKWFKDFPLVTTTIPPFYDHIPCKIILFSVGTVGLNLQGPLYSITPYIILTHYKYLQVIIAQLACKSIKHCSLISLSQQCTYAVMSLLN